MEEQKKNFTQGLLITFGVIILGLVSYIYYYSHILPQRSAPRCEYKGWAYADKEIFDMGDDCNMCFCSDGEVICSNKNCSNLNQEIVQISTDKKGYKQGETINITVLNNTTSPVYYYIQDNSFWKVEKQENEDWINIKDVPSIKNSGVIINNDKIKAGDSCTLISQQQTGLNELKQGQGIESKWVQFLCTPKENLTTGTVQYLPAGQYRFVFTYGNLTEGKPDVLSDVKTVYSDPFTIK